MNNQSWPLPSLDEILDDPSRTTGRTHLRAHIQGIEQILARFEIEAQISQVNPGPRLSEISLTLGPSTSLAKLKRLELDIAVALSGRLLEISKPQPGSQEVRLLVENESSRPVRLRTIIESNAFAEAKGPLKIGLGADPAGQPVVIDLATLPHLLIGGTSRSGKSTCVNAIVASLLCRHAPDRLQLLLIDPAAVELQAYNGIPHLQAPVITQTAQTLDTLDKVAKKIAERYHTMAQARVRDIGAYNRQSAGVPMPYLVVVIDNLFDVMVDAPVELDQLLRRISQKARAAGVHLVMSTFNTKTDALAGAIKANFPGRIAFRVASSADSRLILDVNGAETLLGEGDMYYKAPDAAFLQRVQGVQLSETELKRLVTFWRDAV